MGEVARHFPAGRLTVSTGRVPGSEPTDAGLSGLVDRAPVPTSRLKSALGLLIWKRRAGALARARGSSFAWCAELRPSGFVGHWLSRQRGVPYGLLVHGMDIIVYQEQASRSLRKRTAARRLLGGAAGIVANSGWTSRRLSAFLDTLGLDSERPPVLVVPQGANPVHFRPGLDTAGVRSSYRLNEGPWLLTVARLLPHKGIDVTLRVLDLLKDRWPTLQYAVAGTGPDGARLVARAQSLGVAGRVRWLGNVPERDLPALYNVASIYVGLSREEGGQVEGFGLSLVEAQASGIPVVAGASGGVSDAVSDGVSGLLVPPRPAEAAAQAIARILAEPSLAGSLGRAGRAAVESRLNWDRFVHDLQAAALRWCAGRELPIGR